MKLELLMFWLGLIKNVGWFKKFKNSAVNITLTDSVTSVDLLTARSQLKNVGPVSAMRGRFPIVPGAGLHICAGPKGTQVVASSPTPRLLVLMAEGSMKRTPLPSKFRPSRPSTASPHANAVAGLRVLERPARFNVPRLDRMENGVPLCQMKMEPICQPPISLLTAALPASRAFPRPMGR